MKVILTGIAGFIGYHAGRALLSAGHTVVGIDNLNTYYAVQLKRDRLHELGQVGAFEFHELDIADAAATSALFARHTDATHVLHLAAQAGVRYSLAAPIPYVQANVQGQVSLLEAVRKLNHLEHVVYASSSSVYGANRHVPFSIEQRVESPLSVYAATKLAAEHMAEAYAHLYKIPSTGLRLFTVYGPWGRPDMATYTFARQISAGETISVYNNGDMARDFTYVDDVVDGMVLALGRPPRPNASGAPHRVYNIGNNRPTPLLRFIAILEEALGKRANVQLLPMQPGEVKETFADIEASTRDLGFRPRMPIEEGLRRFVDWYKAYHQVA